jgi:preprotein translocase subunit SecD
MKKNKNKIRLISLIILTLIAALIVWPKPNIKVPKPKFSFDKKAPYVHVSKNGYLIDYTKSFPIKEGLDLQGGSHLVYSADLSKIADKDKSNAMASLQKVVENRVNAFGVSEPQVYTTKVGNDNRLVVELAGVKDTDQALALIGKTAQLEFKEANAEGTDFVSTGLTGKDFQHADVTFTPEGKPQISIEFNSEGAKKFQQITAKNVGKPLAIYLDDKLIEAPNVENEIPNGKAVITGQFSIEQAKELSIQLNAGALLVPVSQIEQRTVGATLGKESIQKSLVAGMLGIIFVSIFMVAYYRLLGVFSTLGLGLYILYMLALFKLFGVVLTMGGIAGLILSVGASMETDVLVFERIREELRNGRKFLAASSLGFQRAWPSIRDSNAVSLIITVILYTAGGTIRGFAFALGLGIVVGLTTTFIGTKSLIELISKYKFTSNNWLFRVEKEEVTS